MGALQAEVVCGLAPGERVESLHERYAPAIRRYCLRRLHSREESEDATQVVFLAAYRSLAEGVDPRSEGAWLFKIAENVVLQRRRAMARRARVEYAVDVDRIAESVAAPPAMSAPELDGVREALASMPESQRQAIVLREWYGLSYREVAEELGVSSTVVEGLIFRARRGLVRRLEVRNRLSRNGRRFGFWLPAEPLKLLFGGGGLGAKVVVGAASIAVAAAATHPSAHRLVLTAATTRALLTSAKVVPRRVTHHRPGRAHATKATVAPSDYSSDHVSVPVAGGGAPTRPPTPDAAPKARGPIVANTPAPAVVAPPAEPPAIAPSGGGAGTTAPAPDASAGVSAVPLSSPDQSAPDPTQPGPPAVTPSGKTPPAVGRSLNPLPPGHDPAGGQADPPGVAGGTPPGHGGTPPGLDSTKRTSPGLDAERTSPGLDASRTPPGLDADGSPGGDADGTPPGQAIPGQQAS